MQANEHLVRTAIAEAVREQYGKLLALLIKDLHDFQLAEDSLQDAIESALVHWNRSGVPNSPAAWLLQAARRKAIDRLRRARNFSSKSNEISYQMDNDKFQDDEEEEGVIADERLRLIFTCCHPALDAHTAVALSLRTLCGLTTAEIARAFVVSEETMAQRLVRARQKIAKAGIAYTVPEPPHLAPRLQAVLNTLYLTYNEGAGSPFDQTAKIDLCAEAIRLCRMLFQLCPDQPEVAGLLALLLTTHARKAARGSSYVPLADQDRSCWDAHLIAEADGILQTALLRGAIGTYQLQAAISAVHVEARRFSDTRWSEIILLYDRLYAHNNNPVYLLNRAVAVSFGVGPEQGLEALNAIGDELSAYQPFHAARADMLRRLQQFSLAAASYEKAIELSQNEAERCFLIERRQSVLQ